MAQSHFGNGSEPFAMVLNHFGNGPEPLAMAQIRCTKMGAKTLLVVAVEVSGRKQKRPKRLLWDELTAAARPPGGRGPFF